MSVAGKLVVELELKDGQYTSRMRQAGQAVQTLSGSLGTLDNRLGRIEKGLSGTLPHLRDIAIVSSSLHSILSGVNETLGGFTRSFIGANSEIERSTVLLRGLSGSLDLKGKAAEAAKDMRFLFDTAKSAPFSLKEITNSFVKMRTVGLNDVEGKVKSLSNAIASFGGDDQSLHRATVAIQQMASKGVISMEELRQQLGESVPNAMQQMADGMGMTMSSMVKNISEGKIKAVPALEGMMHEMELSMAGSSARMMDTWGGMVSQLSTNWMLFQKRIGDGGAFDAAKGELRNLNDFLLGDNALKYAQVVGDSLKSVADSLHTMSAMFAENKEVIGETLKMLLEFWAITKSISALGAIGGGLGRFGKSVAGANQGFKDSILKKSQITTQNRTAGGQFAKGTTTTDITEWVGIVGTVGAALKLLPGPIGLIGLAISLAGSRFIDFGDKASEALDDVIEKQKELNEKAKDGTRIDGDAALKTLTDIAEARANIAELVKERDKLVEKIDKAKTTGFAGKVASRDTAQSRELEAELKDKSEKIALATQAAEESQIESLERGFAKEKDLAKKSVDAKLAVLATEYKQKSDAIAKAAELYKNADKSRVKGEAETNAYVRSSILKLHEETYESQKSNLEKQKTETLTAMQEIADAQGGFSVMSISEWLFNNEKLKSDLSDSADVLRVELATMRAELDSTGDDAKKVKLAENIKIKQGELDETTLKLTDLSSKINNLKTSEGVDWDKVLQYTGLISKLKEIGDTWDKTVGKLTDTKAGKLPSDGALNEYDDEKKLTINRDKVKAILVQQLQQLATASSDLFETHTKNFDKLAVKNGVGMSDGLAKGFADAQGNNKFGSKFKEYLSTAKDMLNESESMTGAGGQDVDVKDIEMNARMVAQVTDAIRAETKALDELNASEDKGVEIRAKINALKGGAAGTDTDSQVARAERELQNQRSLGRDAEAQELLVQSLKSREFESNLLDDKKETNREFQRITQSQKDDAEKKEKFLFDLEEKLAQDLKTSKLALNNDSLALYKEDAKNYVDQQYEKAYEAGVVREKESAQLKEQLRVNYEAVKANYDKLAADNAARAQKDSSTLNAIGRRPGTSIDKDRALAEEQRNQSLNNVGRSGQGESAEAMAKKREQINAKFAEDIKQVEYAHRNSFQVMMEDQKSFSEMSGDVASTFTNGFVDGMAMLASDGSANFREFAASVIKDIGAMIVKMTIMNALQTGMGMMGIFGGGGVSNGGTSITKGFGMGAGNLSAFGFASGGVMNAKKMSQAAMSAGGVASSPRLAYFAEAGMPEAFIPMQDGATIPLSVMRDANGQLIAKALLPGGKSIPGTVTMSNFANGGVMGNIPSSAGNAGGFQPSKSSGAANNIEININIDNTGSESRSSSKEDARWNSIASQIKMVVVKEIADQQRPGGSLSGR